MRLPSRRFAVGLWSAALSAAAALPARGAGLSGAPSSAASAPSAAAVSAAPLTLEQRVERLERLEGASGGPGAMERGEARAWTREGFWLSSSDKDFRLRLGGLIQTDDRAFIACAAACTDTFLVRRARLYIEGDIHEHFRYRLMPDLAAGQQLIQEAWFDLTYWKPLQLVVGKIKEPLDLERQQPEVQTAFVERGLPSNVAPNRDVGVELHGTLLDRRLMYWLALLNGAPDGTSVDADSDNNKDVVARAVAEPFHGSANVVWSDLGLGMAASVGRQVGSAAGLPTYVSESQQSFLSYRPAALADGRRTRLAPQAYWYPGPFGFMGEYIVSRQEATTGPAFSNLTTRSYQVLASWALTGEHRTFYAFNPQRRFRIGEPGWGAWEVAARYSALWVDRSVFPVFADPGRYARRADAVTAGVNWYLSQNARTTLDYTRTVYAGGPKSLEESVLTRLQLSF